MPKDKNNLKKRIFDIIQIGKKNDIVSRLFDFTIVLAITLNISVLFLETFDELKDMQGFFTIIEICTVAFFCVEYALRIWTAEYLYSNLSRDKAVVKFLFSFDGIVDFLTILPAYYFTGFVAFRLLRVIRIFRLFRINAAYDSFNVIKTVIVEKRNQILSSVFIIIILMLASSMSMYAIEHSVQPEAFRNAFSGIWWSLSTIFTVGYGDIYPITVAGKILAIFTTFLGVGVVAIPTGIISAGFVEQYTALSSKAPVNMTKTEVTTVDEGSFYCNKTVERLYKEYDIKVQVLIRNGAAIIPAKDMMVEDDDIIVIGRKIQQ